MMTRNFQAGYVIVYAVVLLFASDPTVGSQQALAFSWGGGWHGGWHHGWGGHGGWGWGHGGWA